MIPKGVQFDELGEQNPPIHQERCPTMSGLTIQTGEVSTP
jgi:hypothetical protein